MGVSVVIPTYNRVTFTVEAIESVRAQTYPVNEIIVIDDGSTDDTATVLSQQFGDSIRYVRQSNCGPSAARNHGLRLARHDWVAFLDSDDRWSPTKLARQFDFLFHHPGVDFVFTDLWVGTPEDGGIEITDETFHQHLQRMDGPIDGMVDILLANRFTITTTLLFRRERWPSCGPFDESMRLCEDLDLWLRAAAQYRWGFVAEPLAFRRRHDGNLVSDWIRLEEARMLVLRKFRQGPWVGQASPRLMDRVMAQSAYDLGSACLKRRRFDAASKHLATAREHGCRRRVLAIKRGLAWSGRLLTRG